MPPLVSAAMIVRNEARFLGACLESIAGVVDEIVVVDTGSTDDTPEIARRFGARVLHHAWRDDFAEARNVSLEAASGAWILYVDADERLVDPNRQALERLLEHSDAVAFRLLLRPTLNATPYREYRLWRNDPRIRFEGIIHEKVVPAIHAVAESDGRPIATADLLLVHLGYEGDQAPKHRRNLPLLRRQLEAEPTNLFAWHHLARVLEATGEREEAERALLAAIEVARGNEPLDPVASLSYTDLIRLRTERGADSSELLEEALSAFPDNCVLLWVKARRLIEEQEFAAAISVIDRILAVDWTTQPDDGPAYDVSIVGELPWSTKALCLFRLGAYEEAAEAYLHAAACAPDDPSYTVRAELARARARRLETGARAEMRSVATPPQ